MVEKKSKFFVENDDEMEKNIENDEVDEDELMDTFIDKYSLLFIKLKNRTFS